MNHIDKSEHILREYARLALTYDTRWSFYTEATAREMMKRLHLDPGERLLDVGCGTGALLQAVSSVFPEVEAVGVDPSSEMLNVARQKLSDRIQLESGWAESLSFPDDCFDVVVSCNAFHYWRHPVKALSEIKRVLKPEGKFAITDWCDDYLTCRACDLFLRLFNRSHFRTYGVRECKALLTAAGFSNVRIERHKISWLWGMMTASAELKL